MSGRELIAAKFEQQRNEWVGALIGFRPPSRRGRRRWHRRNFTKAVRRIAMEAGLPDDLQRQLQKERLPVRPLPK